MEFRVDEKGRVLSEGGFPILAVIKGRIGNSTFIYLGDKETLDEKGEIAEEYRYLLPDKNYYLFDIIRAKIERDNFKKSVSFLKILTKDDGKGLVGGQVCIDKQVVRFVFQLGKSFNDDQITYKVVETNT